MTRLLPLTCLLIITTPLLADDWPAWRGPRGDGVSDEKNLPLTWSATTNVRWKVPMAEPGNSTPIIWGDRIFLTQGLAKTKQRALLALDRKTGKKLWQREYPCDTVETTHKQNPPCSASPVTDGKAVYAWLGSPGVVAHDFEGKELWRRDLGPIVSRWGNGSSPVLYKDLLIVFHGPGEPSTFLIAFDKHTGKTVWKADEKSINSPIFGSWSTPIIATIGKRDELIMPLPGDKVGGEGMFKAYDPNTGKELWTCRGLGNEIYAMPTINESRDLIVAISGHNGPFVGVKPGGNGDVTATHRLWRNAGKNPQRVGSGVFHGGRFFLADAPGLVECIDPKTGEPDWKERLPGTLWGSMLLADSRLYVSSLEGTTYVLKAGPKFELLATNPINEPIYAAPAVSNGELFLRTHQNLYCIGEKRP